MSQPKTAAFLFSDVLFILFALSVFGAQATSGVFAEASGVLQSKSGTSNSATAEKVPDLRSRKTGSDWPAFLGPNGDGKSSEHLVNTDWPASGLPVVWQKELGLGYGAPSVARGRLFIFDRHGDQARLTCLQSETGKEIWHFEYATDYEDLYGFDNGPRTAPVVDDSRVYVMGVEGILSCLDVVTGALIWQVNTIKKYEVVQNFFGVGSTPVIEGNLLISAIGGSPSGSGRNVLEVQGRVEGNGSGIVAFDKVTGKEVYQITNELASYSSPHVTTINGRRWGFLFARGGLIGFEPGSGHVDFHYPWRAKILESVNASNPVVAVDLVFISEGYGPGSSVIRVKPDTYSVVWRDPPRKKDKALNLHWNTAIEHEGYLYASHGRRSSTAEIRCVELKTGKVAWVHRVGQHSTLLFVDGYLISLGERGRLTLLQADPVAPHVLASFQIKDAKGAQLIQYPAWAAPVLSNGFLYIHGKKRLVCLDLM